MKIRSGLKAGLKATVYSNGKKSDPLVFGITLSPNKKLDEFFENAVNRILISAGL